MTSAANNGIIRSDACDICRLCGASGSIIYHDLPDRLFGSLGAWNLKRCNNSSCGLVWLDPMPLEEDIHKAYQHYYTHDLAASTVNHAPVWKRSINFLMGKIYSSLIGMTPLQRERSAIDRMYLEDLVPGRLLELGCGDGSRLAKFSALGWTVEGQEVDPRSAANVSSKQRIKVHLGSLETLGLPEKSYDAIVMNHVIEHIHDPLKLLVECCRLLKPGGVCVASTPNMNGLGHQFFKSFWIGLDPPRHLLLFSKINLQRLGEHAGFGKCEVWTTAANAYGWALGSLQIRLNKTYLGRELNLTLKLFAASFQFLARTVYAFRKDSGDECIIRLTK